jgi:hypothetical protein
MLSNLMPRFRARSWASLKLDGEEYAEGMATPTTLSAPKAATAMSATRLESIPPERPMTTFARPFLST